jgi:hypothetical protein
VRADRQTRGPAGYQARRRSLQQQASLAVAPFPGSAGLRTNSSQADRMWTTYGIVGNRQIRHRLGHFRDIPSCTSIESDLGLFWI